MKYFTFILAICVAFQISAQSVPDLSKIKSQKQKLQVWAEYCDELVSNQNTSELLEAGKKGILLCSKTDFYNLSLFHFYTGITYDYGTQKKQAAFYLEQSEQFGRKAKNKKRVFEALKQLNYVYSNFGQTEKKKRVITDLQYISDTCKDPSLKADVFQLLGEDFINTGKYEQGIYYLLQGIRINRKLLSVGNETDSTNFGVLLINVAELYFGINKLEAGLDYLKESERYIRNYDAAIAHIQKDYVEVYSQQNKLKQALTEYAKLKTFLETDSRKDYLDMLVESDLILARYLQKQKQFQTSFSYLEHARELAPTYADDFLKAQIDYLTGEFYLAQNDYKKALPYLKIAEPFTLEDDPEVNSWLKLALAKTYAGLGNWKDAYRYQKNYSALQDSLLTEKAKKNVAEMETLYQTEKKQVKINQLSAKNTIAELKLQSAAKQRIYFIFLIVSALIVIGLIYFQSRNRKKTNAQLQQLNHELEEANSIKARFFSILNHDLRSPVSNLIHLLHLQKHNPEILSEESKTRLENKTITEAEQLLNTMEDLLVWSKGQMENFQPFKKAIRVEEVMNQLKNFFERENHIDFNFEYDSEALIFTDQHYLETILRNLTGNALKALVKTENPKVNWKFEQTETHSVLSISDNGTGAETSAFKALYDDQLVVGIQTGFGLHLIRDLAKAINCTLKVESKPNNGTTIFLYLPLPNVE